MNTFIPENESYDSRLFAQSKLLLPAISIGNVPQLTVDLLITTLQLRRVGFLEDENIIPVVGSREDTSIGVTVAVEVFQSNDRKWTVIQQRAPAIKKCWHQFANNLLAFIKESQFSDVILLSSADATRRTDVQLTGVPLRVLSTPSVPEDLQSRIASLGLKPLEHVTLDELEGFRKNDKNLGEDSIPHIPGGGNANYFFSQCREKNVSLVVLIWFATEGDNVPDAIQLANNTNSLLDLPLPEVKTKQTLTWQTPRSWEGLFGKPFEQGLY